MQINCFIQMFYSNVLLKCAGAVLFGEDQYSILTNHDHCNSLVCSVVPLGTGSTSPFDCRLCSELIKVGFGVLEFQSFGVLEFQSFSSQKKCSLEKKWVIIQLKKKIQFRKKRLNSPYIKKISQLGYQKFLKGYKNSIFCLKVL